MVDVVLNFGVVVVHYAESSTSQLHHLGTSIEVVDVDVLWIP